MRKMDKEKFVVALSAFVVGSVCAWYVQGLRLDKAVADHNVYVAASKVAQAKVNVITEKQIEIKEVADVDYKTLSARLAADNKRLRDDRSRSSFTPAAPTDTGRADFACFDRTELEQAFRFLDAGISKLAQEGDENTLRLSVGKQWAQALGHPHNPSSSQTPTTPAKEQ
jgi:hypothetical protein